MKRISHSALLTPFIGFSHSALAHGPLSKLRVVILGKVPVRQLPHQIVLGSRRGPQGRRNFAAHRHGPELFYREVLVGLGPLVVGRQAQLVVGQHVQLLQNVLVVAELDRRKIRKNILQSCSWLKKKKKEEAADKLNTHVAGGEVVFAPLDGVKRVHQFLGKVSPLHCALRRHLRALLRV